MHLCRACLLERCEGLQGNLLCQKQVCSSFLEGLEPSSTLLLFSLKFPPSLPFAVLPGHANRLIFGDGERL